MNNFSPQFLKMTRSLLHMNQQEFADRLGVAKTHLSEMESGKKPITTRTENSFLSLLAELDINLYELITMYDSFLRINNQK